MRFRGYLYRVFETDGRAIRHFGGSVREASGVRDAVMVAFDEVVVRRNSYELIFHAASAILSSATGSVGGKSERKKGSSGHAVGCRMPS